MKEAIKQTSRTAKNHILTSLGCLCVVLGVLGIFLPILPTTPFILLAAWLFTRSSEKFHTWIKEHPRFGPILAIWGEGNGITPSVRNRILFYMWSGMLLSMLIVGKWWAVVILSISGSGVTAYLFKITLKQSTKQSV